MTDREALVRAIIERPDDDAPRLIFADWLDENGEPDRAEFIRVQCELANKADQDDHWRELVARAEHLVRVNGDQWTRGPVGSTGVHWQGIYYRGFRRTVVADNWSDMRSAWTVIFSNIPVVQMAINSIKAIELNEFLDRPETRFLRYVFLNVAGKLNWAVRQIAASPAVSAWGVLQIRSENGESLSANGARALVESPNFGGIYGLYLPLTEAPAEARQVLHAQFGDALG